MSDAPKRRWVQFSLGELFFAITLIALGIGGMVTVMTTYLARTYGLFVAFGLWYASGALLGAGLLSPFKKPALGVAVGFLITWLMSSALENLGFLY
jgi:hypothetical protein